jgi:signal peptidase I
MALLTRRRSFTETVEGRRRFARRLAAVFLIFLGFEVVSSFFFAAFAVCSVSMSPTLLPGDRLIVSPLAFGPRTLFGRIPGLSKPERGDLVIVDPPYVEKPGFWEMIADSVVRFLTFQQVSLEGNRKNRSLSGPSIERIIALPGDTVEMKNYVFYIRPAGAESALTEFEVANTSYDIKTEEPPLNWNEKLPLSGSIPPFTLGENEYFVAGDSRSISGDSRLWGAVGIESLRARVILRYWPPARFGSL